MESASTHFSVALSGILLIAGKVSALVVAYHCTLVRMGTGHGHVLCSHFVAVVAHMNPGADVIFDMSAWEPW